MALPERLSVPDGRQPQPPLNPKEGIEGIWSSYLDELRSFAGQVDLIYVQPGMGVIAPVQEKELQGIQQGLIPFSYAERHIIATIHHVPNLTLEQLSKTIAIANFAEHLYALQERILIMLKSKSLSQEHAIAAENGLGIVTNFMAAHPPVVGRLSVEGKVVTFLVHPGSFGPKGEVRKLESGRLRYSKAERVILALLKTREVLQTERITDFFGIGFHAYWPEVKDSLYERFGRSGWNILRRKLYPYRAPE